MIVRRAIAATIVLVLGGVALAQTAGAMGIPWWCNLDRGAAAVCRTVDTGHQVMSAGEAADHAGRESTRVVVEGTALGGTLAGKLAEGLGAVNDRVANAEWPTMPARRLQPGECVNTTTGRYCLPAAVPAVPAPTATPIPVGTCVLDSTGRRWCVS